LRKILTNSDSKCFNGKISCRAYTHALRSHSLRCAHTPSSARSSGRTAFPVDIPDDMMYEIAVDSDPDNLPTTHACIGLVRPFIQIFSCGVDFQFFIPLIRLQGQITLPSAVSKESLKQKIDWALDAGQSFEFR
jgi:hypothetical protein